MDPREPAVADDVHALVCAVSDPCRAHAVVIVSATHHGDRRYGLSPRRLAAAVGDRARVWTLPTVQHNIDFSNAWPDEQIRSKRAVGGGAVRVIGADGWSAVIRTDIRAEQEVIDRIVLGLADEARCPQEGPRRSAPESPPPPPAAHHPAPSGLDEPPSRHTSAVIERLRDELEQAHQRANALEARVAELEATAAADRPVYTDPERQLRHEIEQTWLHHLPEDERDQWPLREYLLGPNLLPLATNLASRDRILAVMVDVLTHRAYNMPARGVHPHHARGAAGKAMVRPDGALAYRAYVKSGAPGAARLLWWELVDGRVELAQVGHHDAVLRSARGVG